MLNTESKGVAGVVWLTSLGIALSFLWSYFDWPHALVVLRNLLDSELANFAARNQVIVSGLLGFGALAIAYVLNGWRDRNERRDARSRTERRDGGVLAREADEIAVACDQAARQLNVRGTAPATVVADLKAAIAPGDHMLLSASASEIARLGPGASGAARAIRTAVRRLADTMETPGKDDAANARQISTRAVEAAFAARSGKRVLEALAKGGPTAADRVRNMMHDVAAPDNSHEEEPRRLMPAA